MHITVTVVFVYDLSPTNTGSDTANITITVTGINDPVVATDDTDAVNEDASTTKTGAQDDVLNDDTDADDSALFLCRKSNIALIKIPSGTCNTNTFK